MKKIFTILFVLLAMRPAMTCRAQSDNPPQEVAAAYRHASPQAMDQWHDLKFGIRIHWGLYSLLDENPGLLGMTQDHDGESWPLRKMTDAQRAAYFNFYKKFNPTNFDAAQWMRLFQRCGIRFFTFTTKHHEGFSMYDTKTRVRRRVDWTAPGGPRIEKCDFAFSIMDTPYHRDIVRELCDAARRHHLGVGLYFSNIDWYDADFRNDGNDPFYDKTYTAQTDPAGYQRMLHRYRAQILELIRNYHPLMVGLDMGQPGISWDDVTQTMLLARQSGPGVLFRKRGIDGYGDYETPEAWVPKSPTDPRLQQGRAWMVIYPMARWFSYDPEAKYYKSARWVLTNLINIVAAGGNFEPAIGPDANGQFNPVAIKRLESVGDWLKVNGEAIYGTRPWKEWKQGDDIRFTRSKDKKYVYAISLRWPGKQLELKDVRPREGSVIRLLGSEQALSWRWDDSTGLVIKIPDSLQAEVNRPCKGAYAFQIEIEQLSASTGPAPAVGSASAGAEDWRVGNLVTNGDFNYTSGTGLPAGWSAVCPNPWIAPEFKAGVAPDGHRSILGEGDGSKDCYGYIRYKVHLDGGKTYRLRVQFRSEDLGDVNRHLVHAVFGDDGFNDGIFSYQKRGDLVVGSNRFPGPKKSEDAEVRLYFRFSPAGKVWWERVSLQECAPIPLRKVKIACSWGNGDLAYWSRWLDRAGEKKVDVALLPEAFNGKKPKQAEPLNGPSSALLAQKAKEWHMYVTGSFYEQRGHLVFNTAPLFDREGTLVGTYSKNELYDPEEDQGVSPGTGLPVFNTDFGKVGIMICYDSWFPEVTRLLAYKGADLVLFPNAGYDMELMPARAADNGVWIAVSSESCPAGIWDSGGAMAGEQKPNPTRFCDSTISGYKKDDQGRMLIATVDLSRRYSPHWWGGPMRSAPGGRRVRQTLNHPIESKIAREAKRWWTEHPVPLHPAYLVESKK